MGKTLGNIIQTIAGAFLVAFSAPLIMTGIAAPVGLALSGIGAGLIVSGVAGVIGGLLGPPSQKPDQSETAIKSARPPRVSAYGTSRLYGAYILYETAEDGTAVDVYSVHDGEMTAIVQRYLADDKITLSGNVVQAGEDGRYGDGNLSFYTTTGANPGTAISAVVSLLPTIWTTDHRGDGVVQMALLCKSVKSKNFLDIYPNGVPTASIAAMWQKCPDPYAVDPLDESAWTWTENAIRQLMHYMIVREGPKPALAEDAPGYPAALATLRASYWARKFAPALDYWKAASDVCDQLVPLKGVQTVLTADVNDGATSVPVASVSGLAVGMAISITQSDNTARTENRIVTSISGLTIHFSAGLHWDHTSGSAVSWASDPANPATEARWRSCVAHKHTDAHSAVKSSILQACDGWIATRSDGAFVVYAGQYYAPTVTIGADEIVSFDWSGVGVDDDDAVNEISCSYVSANHDYNTVETDAWRDEDDITERGEVLSDSLEPQVPSHGQVRRLAKRMMARKNALYRGTVTTNASGRAVRGERFIHLTLAESGATFFDGPAEITAVTRNLGSGGVTFSWVAADANVDAWNPATEEGDPAPVGDRVAQEPLEAPVISSAETELDASGTAARVRIIVDGFDRNDLTWFARWRSTTDASWTSSNIPIRILPQRSYSSRMSCRQT
ncbi:putative tail protein [Novosphingobium sp. PhB165]|uniref:hypothetical protein n=1 Tax=Novosphingobium sp. PhB165 TaxID=2485105 RepID=UPI00104ED910|nr:hypothetical protein [Novosphingobium sp. PhB165]TCM21471.1 putative tail protein [Novosphingobium sp. PhB165]